MKKRITIISIILIIMYLFNLIYISNTHIHIRFEEINTNQKNTNNTSLVFFSDLLIDKSSDYLIETINNINKLHPDIVLFGGNLFSNNINEYDEETINKIKKQLNSINAKKGKFATLGNIDSINEENKNIIKDILFSCEFEILENETIQINNNDFIFNLVGINNAINTDLTQINNDTKIDNDYYTIVMSNTPNTIEYYNNKYNYFLAGNTLGGEVRIPLLGSLNSYNHKYIYNKFYINDSILDITNGIGNINYDYRLFANREIVHYTIS